MKTTETIQRIRLAISKWTWYTYALSLPDRPDTIDEARQWLGMCINMINVNLDDQTKTDIYCSSISDDELFFNTFEDIENPVKKLQFLIQELDKILMEDYLVSDSYTLVNTMEALGRTNALSALLRAKFYLLELLNLYKH